jgi:long-chain fatty acid transport protein
MKHTVYNATRTTLLFGALLLASQSLLAAGFYISEVGTPLSLGTAGAANPTNTLTADSSWTNPAGMTGLNQSEFLAGFQVIVPNMRFDSSSATTASGNDGGNAGNAAPVPSFFYVNALTDRLRLGISTAATMGGGVDYGDKFVGRYSTSMAVLGAVGISPAIAYKVNDKFSLGAGVSIVYTRFDEDVAINQGAFNPSLSDGKLKVVQADDWGYQPYVGLTYHLTERAMLGLVYRAEMDIDLDGDVKYHNWKLTPNKPAADDVNIQWDNPQSAKLGLRYRLDNENTMYLSAGWEDWSQFSDNTLALEGGQLNPEVRLDRNFDDTWNAGFALAHQEGGHATSIGISYESSPVSDRHRTLDLPFDELYKLSFAYGWKGYKDLDFSLGATVYLVGDASIDQTSQGERTKGKFDTNYVLFLGGTARYRF